MTITRTRWTTAIGIAAIAGLAFTAVAAAMTSAEAGVAVGFGFGFPIGFPFYYPPYPPPPYYPPPAPYSPPASPPPSSQQPYQQHSSVYPPSGPAAGPSITYTPRRGWTNAQGQYCREYKATQGAGSRATERYGTACRDATGRWYIVN